MDITSASLDVEGLPASLTQIMRRLMPEMRAVINLIDSEKGELWGLAMSQGEAINSRKLKLSDISPVHGEILTTKQRILFDYESPETDPKLREFMGRDGGRLVLYVPMLVGDKVIGDIAVDVPGKRHEFSQQETQFLEAMASHAAIGIENARLYHEGLEARRLSETLNDINLAINSSMDFDLIMRNVMLAAMAALKAESVLLATGFGEHCRFRYAYGLTEDTPLGGLLTHDNAPLAAAVIKAGKTMAVPEILRDENFNSAGWEKLGIRSSLSTPLFIKDQIFGVVALRYHSKNMEFSQAQIDFLEKFAVTISLAMENSRLFKSEKESRAAIQSYAAQLSLLHEVSLSLSRQRDTGKLLGTVLEGAVELTQAGSGAILLTVKGKAELASVYFAPWNDQRSTILDSAANIEKSIGSLIPRGKDAVRICSQVNPRLPLSYPAAPGYPNINYSLIGVIRHPNRKPRGYFILSSKAGEADFTTEDEEILSLLAAQSSVALTAVQSYESQHLVAETLQAALLPPVPARNDLNIGLLYQSASVHGRIGGDFYDFIDLDGGRIAIAVGDVCGKGIEAATHTAMIKYMLGAFLSDGHEPDECLNRLNRAIYGHVAYEKFVTMCLVVLDPGKDLVTYCLAGHPPPIVFGEHRIELMHAAHGLPLGVLQDSTYTISQTSADSSAVLLYSDGLVEARPAGGKPLSQQKLLDTLAGYAGMPPQEVVDSLFDTAREYAGGNIRDDIAIVAVEMTGSRQFLVSESEVAGDCRQQHENQR